MRIFEYDGEHLIFDDGIETAADKHGMEWRIGTVTSEGTCWREMTLAEILQENSDINRIFDLQHRRMSKATSLWRKCNGKPMVSPDLGKMLDWLMDRGRIANDLAELKWGIYLDGRLIGAFRKESTARGGVERTDAKGRDLIVRRLFVEPDSSEVQHATKRS